MAVTAVRPVAGTGTDISSRAAAEAYVGGVCFKQGPPALVGAELEWVTALGDPSAPRPQPDLMATALGPYAPSSIAPQSPALPLPGGSRVTLEPGGQVELSSAPFADPAELCERLRSDTRLLQELLEPHSVRMYAVAADAVREPQRVLRLPRYAAMERTFAGLGPFGALMMCNTAAAQVSVDAGADQAEVTARWNALYAIGPALLAAFACSPTLSGAPEGSWASQRMRAWLRLDNARVRPPVPHWSEPAVEYARWALDVPLLCVRRAGDAECDWAAPPGATFADWLCGALDDEIGRRPDREDLDYHLTTLFPLVRASGHLEVRYLDAQPGDGWTVPVHAVTALLATPATVAEATRLAAATADRWLEAARVGLADPEIRTAAVELLTLAAETATTAEARTELHAAARRCAHRRNPTGDRVPSGAWA
ncbi:ergothioneine biosynthesis glutamate--cysteine ligase EgtA [Nocardia sp. alder85J]|uniref:ergothioneine biosynthesis glutamate--cysteine ligase EgtA n=1 Tax=Nocardia sp. alder85J TaxID=2862949 RepID=UPI001CD3E32F|nr:ergothioneine biosynthesis glutamate--cysteine ligase EgtA [Nocardia sp. alder85J]MCX4096208.1 ergothioneine biosynthesis glutamate--cysteine ligase EgtA [Nocardia sp. alder85J]